MLAGQRLFESKKVPFFQKICPVFFDIICAAAKEEEPDEDAISEALHFVSINVQQNNMMPVRQLAKEGHINAVNLLINKFGASTSDAIKTYAENGKFPEAEALCDTERDPILGDRATHPIRRKVLIRAMLYGAAKGKHQKKVNEILDSETDPIEKFFLLDNTIYGYASGGHVDEAKSTLRDFSLGRYVVDKTENALNLEKNRDEYYFQLGRALIMGLARSGTLTQEIEDKMSSKFNPFQCSQLKKFKLIGYAQAGDLKKAKEIFFSATDPKERHRLAQILMQNYDVCKNPQDEKTLLSFAVNEDEKFIFFKYILQGIAQKGQIKIVKEKLKPYAKSKDYPSLLEAVSDGYFKYEHNMARHSIGAELSSKRISSINTMVKALTQHGRIVSLETEVAVFLHNPRIPMQEKLEARFTRISSLVSNGFREEAKRLLDAHQGHSAYLVMKRGMVTGLAELGLTDLIVPLLNEASNPKEKAILLRDAFSGFINRGCMNEVDRLLKENRDLDNKFELSGFLFGSYLRGGLLAKAKETLSLVSSEECRLNLIKKHAASLRVGVFDTESIRFMLKDFFPEHQKDFMEELKIPETPQNFFVVDYHYKMKLNEAYETVREWLFITGMILRNRQNLDHHMILSVVPFLANISHSDTTELFKVMLKNYGLKTYGVLFPPKPEPKGAKRPRLDVEEEKKNSASHRA